MRKTDRRNHLEPHPKAHYIIGDDNSLRGLNIAKLIANIQDKISRNKVQRSGGLFYDMEVEKGPRYARIITQNHPLIRLYEVAWEEYWNMPLNQELK